MVNPSTKDFKAIISTTKEPGTASVPFTDQPMVVALPQPSNMDVVRGSFLETNPKELNSDRREGIFHRNLAETVKPSTSTSEEMDTTPEKPSMPFPSLSLEEKPLKTTVERLAEMVSSPSHSSPLARGTSPRELTQTQILTSMSDHSSVMPTTTLIAFTPKIGMGKPAITKRKFSPGRPRVKQVGTWTSCHSDCWFFCPRLSDSVMFPVPLINQINVGEQLVLVSCALLNLCGLVSCGFMKLDYVGLKELKKLVGLSICFSMKHSEWCSIRSLHSLYMNVHNRISHSVYVNLSWVCFIFYRRCNFRAKLHFPDGPRYLPPIA